MIIDKLALKLNATSHVTDNVCFKCFINIKFYIWLCDINVL